MVEDWEGVRTVAIRCLVGHWGVGSKGRHRGVGSGVREAVFKHSREGAASVGHMHGPGRVGIWSCGGGKGHMQGRVIQAGLWWTYGDTGGPWRKGMVCEVAAAGAGSDCEGTRGCQRGLPEGVARGGCWRLVTGSWPCGLGWHCGAWWGLQLPSPDDEYTPESITKTVLQLHHKRATPVNDPLYHPCTILIRASTTRERGVLREEWAHRAGDAHGRQAMQPSSQQGQWPMQSQTRQSQATGAKLGFCAITRRPSQGGHHKAAFSAIKLVLISAPSFRLDGREGL